MSLEKELKAAREAAAIAGKLQMDFLEKKKSIDIKSDDSPVTEVDKACEEKVREHLMSAFPDDGFLGEEFGQVEGKSGRKWIIDPIDGTRPYIRGIPTFSALIALEQDGFPVVGAMELPALQKSYYASRGGGAFLNEQAIHVSEEDEVSNAMASALGFLEARDDAKDKRLIKFMKNWNYNYGFMDAYSYGLVCEGKLDFCVNLLDKAWDCAAAACIVTEAGGRFSDVSGKASVHEGSAILSNGRLHDKILEFFA